MELYGDVEAISQNMKINIRNKSIFENIKLPLPILYFITFYCFLDNYNIDITHIQCNNNCDDKFISKII